MPVQNIPGSHHLRQTTVDVAIIGAGPAGLTAGYLLTKQGLSVAIIERDRTNVGGISRTVEHEGYRFDIGGHRFFSKSQQVVDLWNEILPNDFIQRPRMSRIYYEGKFYSYPLRAFEALWNLGLIRSTLCLISFAKAKAFPNKQVKSFEDWTVNQFGHKLYSIFFKTYTEKVWGMPCGEMSADWAAQRIKGLSLWGAVVDGLKRSLVDTIRRELEAAWPTLHLVGRNGMHRYNNQDHAMMTAMLTVENIVAGERIYDTWCVNEDAEYHEAGDEGAEKAIASARTKLSEDQAAALDSARETPRKVA